MSKIAGQTYHALFVTLGHFVSCKHDREASLSGKSSEHRTQVSMIAHIIQLPGFHNNWDHADKGNQYPIADGLSCKEWGGFYILYYFDDESYLDFQKTFKLNIWIYVYIYIYIYIHTHIILMYHYIYAMILIVSKNSTVVQSAECTVLCRGGPQFSTRDGDWWLH